MLAILQDQGAELTLQKVCDEIDKSTAELQKLQEHFPNSTNLGWLSINSIKVCTVEHKNL